jgi:hypothetical protein
MGLGFTKLISLPTTVPSSHAKPYPHLLGAHSLAHLGSLSDQTAES